MRQKGACTMPNARNPHRGHILMVIMATWLGLTELCVAAPTLEDIERAYQRKQEALSTYRATFRIVTSFKEADGSTQVRDQEHTLTKGLSGYRIERSVVDPESSEPTPWTIATYNGEQRRSLSFRASGEPRTGGIAPPERFSNTCIYTPVSLAGLTDTSANPEMGTPRFMIDIRALAADEKTRLLDEPVLLNGEPAWVLEWPATSEYPIFRFWLSAERDYAFLQYETYDHAVPGKPRPNTRLVNSAFEEVAPGIHLPRKSVFQVLAVNRSNPGQTTDVRLQTIDVGLETTPADFHVEFPDGLPIHDRRFGVGYRQGFLANMNAVATDMRRVASDIPRWMIGLVAVVMLGAMVFAFRVLRNIVRRRRNAATSGSQK